MQRKKAQKKRQIPEAFGNRICGVWPYIIVLGFDAVVHIVIFFIYVQSFQSFLYLFFSFIFFIYPLYYVADSLWSLQPAVCDILSGKIRINRKYYMNTVQREIVRETLLSVTVSVPVYMEDNNTIFETLRQSLAAVGRYIAFSEKTANVLVSDDGIAPMLGGICSRNRIEKLIERFETDSGDLTEQETKAAERILFYRENGIAFVVRPASKRAGLFKKASNLNYTLHLGEAVSKGSSLEQLIGENGDFEGGYAEGDITTHEIILLLDKDSGVKEKILEAIVPEFVADEKLAYVQCATEAVNLHENYYTYATGHQINNLFHNIWPCKALQGFFVPLVGHNAFLRKRLLEKSGLWSENKVSEDYDKALCFYSMGYHGKYAQVRGLEFTEYASRTFTEETGKQRRYAYGLFEMMFDGTVAFGEVRACDFFYMWLYFFSVVNQVLLLPTVLLESYFGNIHVLWAGFIFCTLCFVLLPFIRGLVMRKSLPPEHTEKFTHTFIVAISFVGHSFSFLAGACRYLANKIKENRNPFPSTNVDRLGYSFGDGIKLLGNYIRKNLWFLILIFFCLDRVIFLLTRKGIETMTVVTYVYILACVVVVPILFTPQLFSGFRKKSADFKNMEGENVKDNEQKGLGKENLFFYEGSKEVVFSSSDEDERKENNSNLSKQDIALFLNSYQKVLQEAIPKEGMLEGLLSDYFFESCIKKDSNGKKELYLLRRKKDNARALLRVTEDYPQEDAMEEAKLLSGLSHFGIPKVYDFYEKDGKKYLIREYIEGCSLYEIVVRGGCPTVSDIFKIILKLVDILSYLHAQKPPVIHRDIKPQNIIVGKDGNLYLIDFGIARIHKEESRQDTSVILTLDYASPEQYGFEQTTPLSDIYSLGVVMLFLATGRVVRSDLEAQIINNRLRNLIEQCIAFNPKERIQTVEEIRSYLLQDAGRWKVKQRKQIFKAAAMFVIFACFSVISYGMGFVTEKKRSQREGYERGYEIGYTDGYDATPVFLTREENTDLKLGNSFGNLAAEKGAFAVRGEDDIFYIGEKGIVRMSENGAETELVIRNSHVRGLSYYNGWLYYSSERKIIQTNIYTKETNVLSDNIEGELYVVGDSFYIHAADGIYDLNVSKGKLMKLGGFSGCESLNIEGDSLFFIDKNERGLYRYDKEKKNVTKLIEEKCESICLFEKELFVSSYKGDKGKLVKFDIEQGKTKTVLERNIDVLNVTRHGIYFIDRSNGVITRCSFDGRIREKVSKNRATDFNVVGNWVFYHNEDDNGQLWCVRMDGANDHAVSSKG